LDADLRTYNLMWHVVWRAELSKVEDSHCQAMDTQVIRIMYPRIQLNCSQEFCRQGSLGNRNNGELLQLSNGL
jgi:hypothetical protein